MRGKSTSTVLWLMVTSSNLKSFMSLSDALLREAETHQIQTFRSHGQIFCNWKRQGDKRSCRVRLNGSGWKARPLPSSWCYLCYFIGVTLGLERNTIKLKTNGTSRKMSSKYYFATILVDWLWEPNVRLLVQCTWRQSWMSQAGQSGIISLIRKLNVL